MFTFNPALAGFFMIENFKQGVKYYGDGFKLLFGSKLWLFMIFPIALAFFMVWIGTSLVYPVIGWLNESVVEAFESVSWLQNIISLFVTIILKIVFWILVFVFNKYIVLILLSPVLALLSELVEEQQTGNKFPFNIGYFIKDVMRGILISIRNFFIELLLLFVGFILSFIPVVGLLFPLFSFLLSSYFWGFSMIDYSNERHRMNIGESVKNISQNKYAAIGIGIVFYLLFAIPIIGIIIAPLVSCIAATLFVINNKTTKTVI